MKKIFIALVILLAVFVAGGYLYGKNTPRIQPETSVSGNAVTASISQKDTSIPHMLIIPKLEIEADVESVGLDSRRNMDVPKNAENVAWYNLGARPGEKGNAVLAGHLDTITGAPAVFYELDKLENGDTITVEDTERNIFTYTVTGKETYKTEEFPLQEVFGDTEIYRLNLITCTGTFDNSEKSYSHRTVVYSELKN